MNPMASRKRDGQKHSRPSLQICSKFIGRHFELELKMLITRIKMEMEKIGEKETLTRWYKRGGHLRSFAYEC